MAPKPLLRIRPPAKKTFGEAFGAATGVSDARLQKIRIRNNGAGGKAATVAGYSSMIVSERDVLLRGQLTLNHTKLLITKKSPTPNHTCTTLIRHEYDTHTTPPTRVSARRLPGSRSSMRVARSHSSVTTTGSGASGPGPSISASTSAWAPRSWQRPASWRRKCWRRAEGHRPSRPPGERSSS